jgi:hypothetical protein
MQIMYEAANTLNIYIINTDNNGEISTVYNIPMKANMLRLLSVLFI